MGLPAVLGVSAMTATFTAGLVYWMLSATTDEDVALLAHWGTISLYVWAVGLIATVLVLGDYPYGKHAPSGKDFGYFGPAGSVLGTPVPCRLAWCVQESPAFLIPLLCWVAAERNAAAGEPTPFGLANKVVLGMMMVHYFQRSFIYSLRIRGSKGVPLSLMLCCFFFCAANGLLQGVTLTRHYAIPDERLLSPQFWVGAAAWVAGMLINWQADTILINLRKPGETGYKIPRGGAFEYVSGANFFGEILEWYGWGLAGGHSTGMAFAVFTMFNIAPRACAHHRWYKEKFPEYPKSRKAVLPFIF
eukprot:TRINITY_DN10331_c0_g1_i1.p1 TRINITY_DN10331_c0_g1~~TRINITY_DN10331_c0_g1_i1.p1  ORF type:complete len:336 (+),score=99.36 TRINITY_DN10331_c0_g1_i1:102-1010(+)